MERIIQLVPGLPPMLNGVGDYSVVLAKALREHFGIGTHFAACCPSWAGPDEVDGFPVTPMRERDASIVASTLDRLSSRQQARVALLQLSPYGFERNGAPLWLANALDRWKRASAGRRVVTYFHELYAFGPAWRKAFWLSPLQRLASARIARASDRLATNRAASARWLARAAGIPDERIEVLPVVSNVGEPGTIHGERAARLIVWGGGGIKTELYRRYGTLLAQVVDRLSIESVIDIGSASPDMPGAIGAAAVTAIGVAPAQRIADLLATSAIGCLCYPPTMLGKSGIFAACAAHRLPTLVLDAGDTPRALPDGLARGVHLLTREDASEVSPIALPSIGEHARAWYAGHDAERHATLISRAAARTDRGGAP